MAELHFKDLAVLDLTKKAFRPMSMTMAGGKRWTWCDVTNSRRRGDPVAYSAGSSIMPRDELSRTERSLDSSSPKGSQAGPQAEYIETLG